MLIENSVKFINKLQTAKVSNSKPDVARFITNKNDVFINQTKDLLNKSEKVIKEILINTLNQVPKTGKEYSVYFIPEVDYVFRVPLNRRPDFTKPINYKISPFETRNHVAAKIGDCEIQHLIKGAPCVVEAGENRALRQFELNEAILKMPQKTYSDFLKDIISAAKDNAVFDFTGTNVIINREKKSFTPIDFLKAEDLNIKNLFVSPIEDMQLGFSMLCARHKFAFTRKIVKAMTDMLRPENTLPEGLEKVILKINAEEGLKARGVDINEVSKIIEPVNTYLPKILKGAKIHAINPEIISADRLTKSIDDVQTYIKIKFAPFEIAL